MKNSRVGPPVYEGRIASVVGREKTRACQIRPRLICHFNGTWLRGSRKQSAMKKTNTHAPDRASPFATFLMKRTFNVIAGNPHAPGSMRHEQVTISSRMLSIHARGTRDKAWNPNLWGPGSFYQQPACQNCGCANTYMTKGDSILDLACGTGALFLRLSDLGFHLTACRPPLELVRRSAPRA